PAQCKELLLWIAALEDRHAILLKCVRPIRSQAPMRTLHLSPVNSLERAPSHIRSSSAAATATDAIRIARPSRSGEHFIGLNIGRPRGGCVVARCAVRCACRQRSAVPGARYQE